MIHRILVAADFSATSVNSLRFVRPFIQDIQAELLVLHVMPEAGLDLPSAVRTSMLEKEKKKKIRKLHRLFGIYPHKEKKEKENLKQVEFMVLEGNVVEQITQISQTKQIDLIVIGTKEKHSLEDYLLGSVSTNLIRKTSLPILIIPQGCTYHQFRKIAFASSNYLTKEPVINFLEKLAVFFGASLTQFHVHTLPRDFSSKKEEIVNTLEMDENTDNYSNITIIRDKSVLRGIDFFIEKNRPDLLALYLSPKSFFGQLIHRSKSKQLVYRSKVPLLLIS
nr:putative universal stress protein [uncultured bacterium]